jgi:DNA-binding SARP family transcriptional activator
MFAASRAIRVVAMEFRILGPVEAVAAGRAITLGGGRQRALLALLLLHANQRLSSERLLDELWGERPPATAAKTVQVYISRLRRALAHAVPDDSDGVVLTREHGYELRLDPERLDAHRFERLVAEGRSELAADHPERARSRLEEALALWRGEPLGDLAYEPFAQREIARLEELRMAARELLVEARLALGCHAELVGELERLVAEHPYRERLRAQLMLALYRSERQADALQAYQNARRTLVEQLGIEPGERLRGLERAILAQDPGLQLAMRATPTAPEPTVGALRSALADRERELAELAGPLKDALAGRGRLLLLALVEVDDQTRTSVPGVYAAGEIAVAPKQMAATGGNGHLGGIAAVRELVPGRMPPAVERRPPEAVSPKWR